MIDDVPDNTPLPPADKPDALTALKAPAPPAKIPVAFGLTPTTIDEAFRLSQALARSSLVPTDYRNKPDDVLVAIQLGAEIGFAPMQALQSVCVINGRPTIYGDGLLALILTSPLYESHAEFYDVAGIRADGLDAGALLRDETAAVCSFWRRGQTDPIVRRFSIADAKRAGLWGKAGPWQGFPARMLRMRARSWAARDAFADVLRGLRAAEEAIDDPPEAEAAPRRVPRLSDPPADLHAFVDRTNDTRHDPAPTPAAVDDEAF